MGAYGKMPGLGDFFRIGLSRAFVGPWDAWVQQMIQTSRTALGEGWQDHYMSAPIWRFQVSAGVLGPSAALGVMMPSVDRVGRQFPLALVAEGFALDDTGFALLENIALDALDETMTKDKLAQALGDVKTSPLKEVMRAGSQWHTMWEGRDITFSAPHLPQGPQAARLFDLSQNVLQEGHA